MISEPSRSQFSVVFCLRSAETSVLRSDLFSKCFVSYQLSLERNRVDKYKSSYKRKKKGFGGTPDWQKHRKTAAVES